MNRELISEALNHIEDTYVLETMTYQNRVPNRPPERSTKMNREQKQKKRGNSRRLCVLTVAACLVFALAITAYAVNLWGIREMSKTPFWQLPELADGYIQQHTETSHGEDWDCRITESLNDGTKIMVTVAVSGGERYILAPTDAMPDDPVGTIGLSEDQSLAEYAESQGKELLFVGATLRNDESLNIFHEAQRHENISDSEMAILISADQTESGSSQNAVCTVYAVDANGENMRLEMPFTLMEEKVLKTATFIPEDSNAIPGIHVEEATVTETLLGYTVCYMQTITDQNAFERIAKIDCDELTSFEGGLVLENDGNWYLRWSMGKGNISDTLTVHFYDETDGLIGNIVFRKK